MKEPIRVLLTQASPNFSEHVKHDGKRIKFQLPMKYISIVFIVIACLDTCHMFMMSPLPAMPQMLEGFLTSLLSNPESNLLPLEDEHE